MSWFLTLNSIHMTIVDFELVVASREYGEYVFIICNYNICVFYNKLGNCIVISNRNISVITLKVVLLFFFTKCQPKHKLDQISSIPNVTPHTFHPPTPHLSKNLLSPKTGIFGKVDSPLYEGGLGWLKAVLICWFITYMWCVARFGTICTI